MRLRGELRVPGDKSIGHRACILAALGDGAGVVRGLGAGGDLRSTRGVLRAAGVEIAEAADHLRVEGVGLRGLRSPSARLDCGNSGTTIRLMAGVLAGQPGLEAVLDGDASLRKRPMRRVLRVLEPFGAELDLPRGDHPPVTVKGRALQGAQVDTELSSAQVKSAALLAGLVADGETRVSERGRSRDHTERMLAWLGAGIEREGLRTTLRPPASLPGVEWAVPGDVSSAAFWLAAAALLPGSELTVVDVGLNPTRTGFLDVLGAMGADLDVEETGQGCGEPVGRVRVRGGGLRGARIDGDLALRALDELPLVAVLGALAEGETVVADAGELRVKESDRVVAMADALSAMGARVEARPDGWRLEGVERLRGAEVRCHHDHRVAMASVVAGLRADGEVRLDTPEVAAVSYPGFIEALCARLEEH